MKKIFSRIAVLLTVSSLTFPLTACVFNFYINSASNTVIKNFADQTSSIIKSLIMAKEKNSDTSQTISDILNQFPNSSIKNQTSGTNLETWNDFTKHWGLNEQINISNFDTKDYFRASGTGNLTKQINNYENLNSTFDKLKLILGINVANNRTIYNLLVNNSNIKDIVIKFLNQTKVTNPDELPSNSKTIMKLLKNIVVGKDWKNPNKNSFNDNLIEPIISLLNYLVEGWWAPNTSTPSTSTSLIEFMTQWKDKEDNPYSQFTKKDGWKLRKKYYESWNETDYNFYRSGTLINYLFYKIGKDYQIIRLLNKKEREENKPVPVYKDRYLGTIISDYIYFDDFKPEFDDETLAEDIKRYVPHLLENPYYILLIIESIVPIIKQWGLQMSNITQGVKHLTFGKFYPNDDSKNSYNMLNVLNNIDALLNNSDELEKIIKTLIGWAPKGTAGQSFTYDIAILNNIPLGALINGEAPFKLPDETKQTLVNTIMNLVNTDTVRGAFKNILNIFNSWVKQYDDKNKGIDFDLTQLKDFFLNKKNGLITIINRDIIPVLYNIFTDPDDLDEAKYLEFYESIGGKAPKNASEQPPIDFRDDSLLSLAKNKISNPDEPLGQIVLILFGNSSENINGIFDFIIKSNNQWIHDNYKQFFDINNTSNGSVSNLIMTTNRKNNIISDTLSYTLIYKINNKTYHFEIKCKSYDDAKNYTGTKNFKFTDIILNSIK